MARNARPEEKWVAACMQAALPGVHITLHDDNSAPSMHDLDVWEGETLIGAAEVTAAADRDCVELWNLVNGTNERWIVPELRGGWMIMLTPRARANRLRRELPQLLAGFETAGVQQVSFGLWEDEVLTDPAAQLGVMSAHQSGTNFPGSIYLSIEQPSERTGGAVPETGDPLAVWLTEWAAQPSEAANLNKLRRSGADQRHLFVLLPGFATGPFQLTDLLMRPSAPSQRSRPRLPDGLTHIWAMSTWTTGDGFAWSAASQWTRFAKITEQP